MAEGVGFEPTVGCPTAVFKTAAINRSTTPPWMPQHDTIRFRQSKRDCKGHAAEKAMSLRQGRGLWALLGDSFSAATIIPRFVGDRLLILPGEADYFEAIFDQKANRRAPR